VCVCVSRAMTLPISRQLIKANDQARSRAILYGFVANLVTRI
jgi:hypothetical protein